MIKNNYTIFVSPPKAGKTRNFSFRKSTLYILIFLLFLFIIGDFIAIVKYRESAKLNNENIRLKTEKSKLEEVAQIDRFEPNQLAAQQYDRFHFPDPIWLPFDSAQSSQK